MVFKRSIRHPRCQVSHGARHKSPLSSVRVAPKLPYTDQVRVDTPMVESEIFSVEPYPFAQTRQIASDQNGLAPKVQNKIEIVTESVVATG